MDHKRLSDRIMDALKLAIEQKDMAVAEVLNEALELSITRRAGGQAFVERRDVPADYDQVIQKLHLLRTSI